MGIDLVDTDDGITVIDAGLAGHWRDLEKELHEMGRPLSHIRGVILTHGDSDHVGFAERLRSELGIPVYVHSADAARAKGEKPPKTTMGSMKIGAVLGFASYSLRKGGLTTTWLKEVETVEDGDILALPGAPVIIGMPGHSPGSIAVHVPLADAVFVGDALTTRSVLTGKKGAQPAPFTDDPAQELTSLGHLAGLKATWILPGHGTPWKVDPSRVEAEVRAAR
ncbi:MBL fold metallo-hydrolase [soil metagenome]